jgi:7-cyano-7-deazaguanine synthase
MARVTILAYSGGLDSTVLLYKALKEYDKVHAIIFDYGQRHNKEITIATNLALTLDRVVLRKLDVRFLKAILQSSSLLNDNIEVDDAKDIIGDPQPAQNVPWRNTIFLSILLGYAESHGINKVWFGATEVDSVSGHWDGSPEYLEQLNNLAALNRKSKAKVEAPLITKSKAEIVKMGVKLGVPFDKTWTCYKGENESCSVCPACSLRIGGFIEAGYIDPLKYQKQPNWEKLGCKHYWF